MVFGTDWPGVPGVQRNARALEKVLLEAGATPRQVTLALGGNAARSSACPDDPVPGQRYRIARSVPKQAIACSSLQRPALVLRQRRFGDSSGERMKTRAAIMRGTGQDWEVTELELDPPKVGEVLVRFVASGLCHSDEHIRTGDLIPRLPIVGGHEGAGVVEEVGPGVTRLKAGDHIVCSFLPVCGHCRWCSTGKSNLCDLGATILDGCLTDGTYRFHTADGEDVGGMCMLGTFSEYATVSELSCVKVDDDLPLDKRRADRLRRAHRLGLGRARGGG